MNTNSRRYPQNQEQSELHHLQIRQKQDLQVLAREGYQQSPRTISNKPSTRDTKPLTQNLKPAIWIVGLFVHIEFDTNIRVDLIAQLISTFDLRVRGSYVNGLRIAVNQAALALARAFKLPVKKDKSNASAFSSEVVNLNSETLSEESIAFIENFVSNRFLLHGGMWQMTVEVLNWRQAGDKRRAVREGGLGLLFCFAFAGVKEEDYVENPKVVAEVTLEEGGGEPKLVAEVKLKEKEGGEEPKVEAELELKEKDGGEEPKVVMEVVEGGEEPKVVAEVEFKEEEGGEERKVEVEEDGEEHKVEAVFEVKEEENSPEVNMARSDDFQGQESHDDVMMEAPNVDLTLGLENIEMEVEEQGVEEPKVVAEVEVKVEEGDKESKVVEVGLKEEENGEEPKLEAQFEVEEEDGEEPKVEASDDFRGQESDGDVVVEAPYVVLTLAQEIVETEEVKDGNMMDIEKSKEVKGPWLLDGKNTTGDHFLQPCNMEDDKGMDSDNKERKPEEEEEKEDEDEEEEDDGFNLTPGGHNLEGIETCQIPFSLPKQLHGQSDMEPLTYGTETHTSSSGPSILGNKRLRTDDSWGHKSSDFEMCMEQVHHWMGQARMMCVTKELACEESNMNQQIIRSELQHWDHTICRRPYREQMGKIYLLECELYVMGDVLEGYRKALKETHKAFIEYRQQFNRDMVPGRGSASQHQRKNIKWSPNPVVFTNDVMSSFGMMLKS
ncbi:unnamed protein product [Camellia sinensis]